jgi:hypothetical protein
VGVAVPVAVAVGVGLGEAVTVPDGVGVGVAPVPVGDAVGVGVGVGVPEFCGVGVWVGVIRGVEGDELQPVAATTASDATAIINQRPTFNREPPSMPLRPEQNDAFRH